MKQSTDEPKANDSKQNQIQQHYHTWITLEERNMGWKHSAECSWESDWRPLWEACGKEQGNPEISQDVIEKALFMAFS